MNNTLVYNYTLGNDYPPPALQYDPVRWIAYLMAAVCLPIGVQVGMVGHKTNSLWLGVAGFASILMFISLVLRGAMGKTDADPFKMYEAEMSLHLCAGFMLTGVLFVFAAKWIESTGQNVLGIFLVHMGIGYGIATTICASIGVPLLFEVAEWKRQSGYKLISISLILSIVASCLAGLLTLYHTKTPAPSTDPRITVVFVPALLSTVWISFMLARFTMPMDNAANTSEALFYCFSVLPAIAVVGMWAGCAKEFLSGLGTPPGHSDPSMECCCCGLEHDGSQYYEMTVVNGSACNDDSQLPLPVKCARCRHEAMIQRAIRRYT